MSTRSRRPSRYTDGAVADSPRNPARWVQRTTLSIAAAAVIWAAALMVLGGIDTEILGRRIRSNDAFRPLLIAAIALAVSIAAGGDAALRRWAGIISAINERVVVAALAVATLGVGVMFSTTAAAGADAYGYVQQADQWIEGRLHVPQAWVAELPWPSRDWTSAPLGYKPLQRQGEWTIVPTYSPGLPLLMAGAKIAGGHGAMFWMVPLCGAALVLATYGVGSRLGAPRAGVVGAWLTATSPAFLYTLVLPWSDVPAAAAWTIAIYYLLGKTAWTAAGAGTAAGIAILIRPNLVWAAPVLGLWFVVRVWRDRHGLRSRIVAQGLAYAVMSGLGILAVAVIYQHLYGSPFESGYGRLSDNFRLSRIATNLPNYIGWLIETHTPVVLAGFVALLWPAARFWPAANDRWVFGILSAFAIGVWLMYCSYLVFDGWPFLRFLLPALPLMTIGVGTIGISLTRSRGPGVTLLMTGVILALGVFFQFRAAADGGVFRLWKSERRYVSAAKLTAAKTEANSVVFSMEHSGTARYYGSRMTLRYDMLDAVWLDGAIEWLTARGVHAYLLVNQGEMAEFERRFAGQRASANVRANPVFIYDGAGTVTLYDLTRARSEPPERIVETFAGTRAVPPASEPAFTFTSGRR
jgi:hypothetical protein